MFDLNQIKLHRKKYKENIVNSEFYQFICTDIIDRLTQIDKSFSNALIIGQTSSKILISLLNQILPSCNITVSDSEDTTSYTPEGFDLIIFPFGLHWINDVQEFLYKITKYLHPDGIFLCNFPSSGTLRNLRIKLIEEESKMGIPHTPHISPFIGFDQVSPLLQQAGFVENIIDVEKIELEYESPLALMKTIQKIGESNALKNARPHSVTKEVYKSLQKKDNKIFTDQINLVTSASSKRKNTIVTGITKT